MARTLAAALLGGAAAMTLSGCMGIPGLPGASLDGLLTGMVSNTQSVQSFRAQIALEGAAADQAGMSGPVEMEYTSTPEALMRMDFTDPSTGEEGSMLMRESSGEFLIGAQGEWLRFAAPEGEAASGGGAGEQLSQGRQQDPLAQLQLLTASGDVEEVGREEVNGVPTTHYTGTYALADALAAVEDPAERDALQQLYGDSVEAVPYDVWIDNEQLPRRVSMEAAGTRTTIDFLEFNQAVDIRWPSEEEIIDFEDMLGGLGGDTGQWSGAEDLDLEGGGTGGFGGDIGEWGGSQPPDTSEMEESLQELEESLENLESAGPGA
ncbi:hypothetical protein [Allonocardiopsis opalescens]|uniref:Uncharacterized protein n=1 Tax=Allonocardiopsis opalescens TaxID=1144618 RepID=A0A2T0Q855_9ACTN|nr:hypothetical protein [Allonocardiopsis opalescens]PRX99962.1 hypothetical protein CLV72_103573 [Allonocardiopsis opalescens]